MDAAVAGRIAEELVFGVENAETGAMADFKSLMHLARGYVMRFGFSEKVCFVGEIEITKALGGLLLCGRR